MSEELQVPAGVDPTVPAPARMYDYYLGGTNNFPADRETADKIMAVVPELSDSAWANRGFHQRAARWMADQGIGQFIGRAHLFPLEGRRGAVLRRPGTGFSVRGRAAGRGARR